MGMMIEAFHNGVCYLTFNRPEKKNAMSEELVGEFYRSLKRAEREVATIVVIRGAEKTFSSGGDVNEFMDWTEPGIRSDAMINSFNKSILLIRTMPAIVIAVIEGLAVGGAVSLSLACDLTLAEENAVMNMGYRRIGLTPDAGGSIFLPHLVGMKLFNELYFLSRSINMAEAREIGIVNFVVSEGEIDARLAALIEELKAMPPGMTQKVKELVNLSLFGGLSSHLDKERLFLSHCSSDPEFQERLRRLFKK